MIFFVLAEIQQKIKGKKKQKNNLFCQNTENVLLMQ